MQTLDRVYSNFANSLKSPQTRSKYEYNLKKFLISNKISINNFVSLPGKDIENMLIDYITKMKTCHVTVLAKFSSDFFLCIIPERRCKAMMKLWTEILFRKYISRQSLDYRRMTMLKIIHITFADAVEEHFF